MSIIQLDIENLEETRKRVRSFLLEQDRNVAKIRDKVEVHKAKSHRSRKLFAVDSGLNSAYETPFAVFKAAVVDEEMEVDHSGGIYLFQVNNYQTDRLKRLLLQQIMYEALSKTVKTGAADGSMVLVDGTITLTVFYPTLKDNLEYKERFKSLYEKLYSPLVDHCREEDIILLGFLKRSGSSYLAQHLRIGGIYDIYIMNSLLRGHGQHIPPIPIVDTQAGDAGVYHKYVTFYLNLKGWNYRFELLELQEDRYMECIENLLFWATDSYYGMNPVFSKADEYARVAKREADLKFKYIIQGLPDNERIRLSLEARKRTHFGYGSKELPRRLMKGRGGQVTYE